MAEYIKLQAEGLEKIREMNPCLISYNVEMTEVTGGTFWKAYTDAQIDGTEQVPPPDFSKGMGASAGSAFPAPGLPAPTTILTAPACPKATTTICARSSG